MGHDHSKCKAVTAEVRISTFSRKHKHVQERNAQLHLAVGDRATLAVRSGEESIDQVVAIEVDERMDHERAEVLCQVLYGGQMVRLVECSLRILFKRTTALQAVASKRSQHIAGFKL